MSRNAIWPSIGQALCKRLSGNVGFGSMLPSEVFPVTLMACLGVLIHPDHFLAGRVHIPSGCCHLVGSSTCLFYLHDGGTDGLYACIPTRAMSFMCNRNTPAASKSRPVFLLNTHGEKMRE